MIIRLREAGSAAATSRALAFGSLPVAGLPVADRTRHRGQRPCRQRAMPRIYGVTDSPHGSGLLRPPASAGAASLATMSGLSDLSVEPMTAAITITSLACPAVATGPCRPRIVSIPLGLAGRQGTAGRKRGTSRSCRSHDPSSIPARTQTIESQLRTRPPPATWWSGDRKPPGAAGTSRRDATAAANAWPGVPCTSCVKDGAVPRSSLRRHGSGCTSSPRSGQVPISLYRRRR